MSKQNIFYEQGGPLTGDSGERGDAAEGIDSVKPVQDGESATNANLARSTENLRKRTEVLRDKGEQNLYLQDADMKWAIWAGNAAGVAAGQPIPKIVDWDPDGGVGGEGQFEVTEPLVLQPLNTPATDLQETKNYHFDDLTNTADLDFTPTSTKRAYNGANLIRIKWVEKPTGEIGGAGAPGYADAELSGDPEHIVTITIRDDAQTQVSHVSAVLAIISAQLTSAGISFSITGVISTFIDYSLIPVDDLDYFLSGTMERELHYIPPTVFSDFFGGRSLADGDTLAVQFAQFVEEDPGTDGRRQRIYANSNTEVLNGEIFNTSEFPERIPLAIPLCKRLGDVLIWLDGTIVTEASSAGPGGMYFGEHGYQVGKAFAEPDFSLFSVPAPVATGTHTGANGQSDLTDGTKTWSTDEHVIRIVVNETDLSWAAITSNTSDTVVGSLSEGGLWDTGDAYSIYETKVQLTGWYYVGEDIQGTAFQYFAVRGYGEEKLGLLWRHPGIPSIPETNLSAQDKEGQYVGVEVWDSTFDHQLDPSIEATAGFYENPVIVLRDGDDDPVPFRELNLSILAYQKKTYSTLEDDPPQAFPYTGLFHTQNAGNVWCPNYKLNAGPEVLSESSLVQQIQDLLDFVNARPRKAAEETITERWLFQNDSGRALEVEGPSGSAPPTYAPFRIRPQDLSSLDPPDNIAAGDMWMDDEYTNLYVALEDDYEGGPEVFRVNVTRRRETPDISTIRIPNSAGFSPWNQWGLEVENGLERGWFTWTAFDSLFYPLNAYVPDGAYITEVGIWHNADAAATGLRLRVNCSLQHTRGTSFPPAPSQFCSVTTWETNLPVHTNFQYDGLAITPSVYQPVGQSPQSSGAQYATWELSLYNRSAHDVSVHDVFVSYIFRGRYYVE